MTDAAFEPSAGLRTLALGGAIIDMQRRFALPGLFSDVLLDAGEDLGADIGTDLPLAELTC